MAIISLASTSEVMCATGALLGLAFGVFTIFGVYQIFFHPLRAFPGPLLAKWSDGYMAYYAWRGDRHLELYRMHQKYGPVVRIGPNTLTFSSASALKTIYGHRTALPKSEFYTAFPANPKAYNVHSTIDKKAHLRKRRVLSHAFSDTALKAVEPYVIANIETGCRVLADTIIDEKQELQLQEEKGIHGMGLRNPDGWGCPVNAAEWTNHLTFDIMGDLAFGKSFRMLTEPTNRFAADLVTVAAHNHLINGTHLLLHRANLGKILFPTISAGKQRYLAYSRAQLVERQKLGTNTDRKDFFYYLLQSRQLAEAEGVDPSLTFTDDELWGESNVLIIAGSDTTSTALSAILHYLINNPTTALERLMAEIRTTFSSMEEIVTGSQLSGCNFLRACVDEALRLAPPVPGYLPRKVTPGGLKIDGVHIPAMTNVGVPHYVIHHCPEYYPQPFEFIPERWIVGETWPSSLSGGILTESTTESVAIAQSAFCPFSIGPRGCIGKSLAYSELTTIISRMLFQFDIRPAPVQPSSLRSFAAMGNYEKLGQQAQLQQCPYLAGQMSAQTEEKVVTMRPFEAERMAPGEYPLMDTFTSRKDGPMFQVRNRI